MKRTCGVQPLVTTTLKAQRIELDPTVVQVQYFKRACGVARFAYNWGLAEWQRQYD